MNDYDLKADCRECFGLCCIALYFSASDGFPKDKEAGKPCINLKADFKCSVHNNLEKKGFKGCIAYDCLGAGQKTAKVTYGGQDWRQKPEAAKEMFEAFLIMRQLHEMLWYLTEGLNFQIESNLKDKLKLMIKEIVNLTDLEAALLLKTDMVVCRSKVNSVLLQISESLRARVHKKPGTKLKGRRTLGNSLDFIGKDLRKKDLRGENLSGAYFIAADLREMDLSWIDFLGADLRDADLRGADLTSSIFLTQAQINTAKGDIHTRLPKSLTKPAHWLN